MKLKKNNDISNNNIKKEKPVLIIYTGGIIGLDSGENISWNLLDYIKSIEKLPFQITVLTFEPLLTPSNLTPSHWINIATLIERNYENCQGVVIIHDTNIITYTASALSFIIDRLSKPIILTNFQFPLNHEKSNDDKKNIINALKIAAPESMKIPIVPEVCVFFGDKLLRGNRAQYVHSSKRIGFESPFYPELGNTSSEIKIYSEYTRAPSMLPLLIHRRLVPDIISFDIFPGIPLEILQNAFENREIKGIILKTFGREDTLLISTQVDVRFLRTIKSAKDRGIIVVNITEQSKESIKERLHKINAELLEKGVISGIDMTHEAALCKLMYLIGGGKLSSMQIDLRGEQSINIYDIDFGVGRAEPSMSCSKDISSNLVIQNIYKAILRIQGIQFLDIPDGDKCKIKVFINYQNNNLSNSYNTHYFGGEKEVIVQSNKLINIEFDVTDNIRRVVNPTEPINIKIIINKGRSAWRRINLEIYADVNIKEGDVNVK